MRKQYTPILILILIVFVCRPASAQTRMMTLDDCLEYANKNNPSLKAADYGVEASEEARKSVRGDFMPSLSIGYSLSRLVSISVQGIPDNDYLDQNARNFSLRLSQVLYAGSRIVNSYDKAKIEKEKKMADRALAELELAYRVQVVFFQLMGAEQDEKVALESVKNLGEGVNSANAYFSKQLISYADVLSAKVDLDDAQQRLSIAKNEVNRKRVSLFSLMNLPISNDVRFTGGLDFFSGEYEADFDRCWEIAKENRPDLDSLEQQVAGAQKQAQIALGTYLPLVKLDLGYYDQDTDYDQPARSIGGDYDRDQRNRYWSAGVSANWELFDGGRAWHQSQKSSIEAKQIREMIKETQLSIKEGIQKALFAISEANLRITGAKAAVDAAEENFKMQNHMLTAGLTTIPLLLDAQIRLTRARGNYTQAILAFMLGRAELQFMMGKNN